MIAFVLPTRNRPADLARTIAAVGKLPGVDETDRFIVVDNASDERPDVPRQLANGARTRLIRRGRNEGAAARNAGVNAADTDWVFMLDDDSHPEWRGGPTLRDVLAEQPEDVAALMADIHLPAEGVRESGGLPEVFIGCGVAIRRSVFEQLGGYDPSFNYYVEEYDLAARLIAAGFRVAFDRRLRVAHHKVTAGRDMDVILGRLVRNNGWIAARYAPPSERDRELEETISRYRRIAEREHAVAGYEHGLAELERTIADQPSRPMSMEHWDRFTGLAAARDAIAAACAHLPIDRAAIVCAGKNRWAVERAIREAGIELARGAPRPGDAIVIGTLSPGPMLDAAEMLTPLGRRVITPWAHAAAAMTPA